MGKALIIKGANFYENRLGVIEFTDIPCTGITLDQSSAEAQNTLTLHASVLPANTTDIITWSSSNPLVASVFDGVVTVFANGETTITATCGGFSATCDVIATVNRPYTKEGLIIVSAISSGTKLLEGASMFNGQRYITFGASDGTYPCLGAEEYSNFTDAWGLYPMLIPSGASKVKVSCPSGLAALVVYFDKNAKANIATLIRDSAKVLDGQTPTAGTNWSISGWEYGNKEFVIPTNLGINACTIGFYTKTADAYANFDPSTVQISFE